MKIQTAHRPGCYIHLCKDDSVEDYQHPNKRKANDEFLKSKIQLGRLNKEALDAYIQQTNHLTMLHTLQQITGE